MFDMKFMHFNVDCVSLNVYCVLSFRFTCLFTFLLNGADAMCGGLKVINQYKIKYDTSLNSCKSPP